MDEPRMVHTPFRASRWWERCWVVIGEGNEWFYTRWRAARRLRKLRRQWEGRAAARRTR